jgi:hypothetical protein
MAGNTDEQSRLSLYAQDVMRQNGIKTVRLSWKGEVLTVEVDPSKAAMARSVLPIIQRRALAGYSVVLSEGGKLRAP